MLSLAAALALAPADGPTARSVVIKTTQQTKKPIIFELTNQPNTLAKSSIH